MSRPKWKPGSVILTMDELWATLEKDGLVYFDSKVYAYSWVWNWKFKHIASYLKSGYLRKAEPNENK
ncbi:MAG: hypothetical protein DRP56_09890 [Planctomycetota bacterium]|nr:MAG: hypothetical protein DRP56_09890 [Planctomycetota bacterium]